MTHRWDIVPMLQNYTQTRRVEFHLEREAFHKTELISTTSIVGGQKDNHISTELAKLSYLTPNFFLLQGYAFITDVFFLKKNNNLHCKVCFVGKQQKNVSSC